jgi:hypothetical protein
MAVRSIQLSEEVYQRLHEQAVQLQLTPEQVVERLLASDLPTLAELNDEADLPIPPAGSPQALAAVNRLTTLFADVAIPHLDVALADPMIAHANAGIDELLP